MKQIPKKKNTIHAFNLNMSFSDIYIYIYIYEYFRYIKKKYALKPTTDFGLHN